MADGEIRIDREKFWRLACRSEGTYALVDDKTQETAAKANSLGSSYRTGKYHRDHKSPAVGGTQPSYGSNTQRRGSSRMPVGIVYTGNYAAQKDNMLHNTLLKSL